MSGFLSQRPLLNATVVHRMMNEIAAAPLFAVIETDYFGGNGDQAAAVYRGGIEVMPPEAARRGPINKALRTAGVLTRVGLDEFDTIGLGEFRNFDDLFDSYCEDR